VPSTVRPRFGKLAAAVAYSGRSRSRIYEWAAQYLGLIRKDGASSLVDFDILDQILDALPVAEIKPQRRVSVTASQGKLHESSVSD
jgi:hypothetical protein